MKTNPIVPKISVKESKTKKIDKVEMRLKESRLVWCKRRESGNWPAVSIEGLGQLESSIAHRVYSQEEARHSARGDWVLSSSYSRSQASK
ncbi:hypothetical protein ACET3Z_026609 [Daucus carota]